MKKFPHGLASMVIFGIALLVGFIPILEVSVLSATFYLMIIIFGFIIIIYSYCTKCDQRFDCGHIILGKIAKWLPKRSNDSYSTLDYLGVLVPIMLILFYPQPLLWQHKYLPYVFWLLLIISSTEIIFYVCPKCQNTKCTLCKNCSKKKLLEEKNHQ